MNYYEIWCNLKDSHTDLEFAAALRAYLAHLQSDGRIRGFRLARRKLGFGPPELGEFQITIETDDLVQLESAFDLVSTRSGEGGFALRVAPPLRARFACLGPSSTSARCFSSSRSAACSATAR